MEKRKEEGVFVSFDIGVKNLSCCVLNVATKSDQEVEVLLWKIMPLAQEKEKIPVMNEIAGRLFLVLDELVETLQSQGHEMITHVLIENQPSRLNGSMKSIQMMIYSYFQLRKHWDGIVAQVSMISASQKLLHHELSIPECTTKTGYQLNKWKAVQYAQEYIKDCAELSELFRSHKKKDDLADAMLQSVSWLRKHGVNIQKIRGACV